MSAARLGCVVIGRNEGERLRRCLGAISGRAEAVVYVDSGSSDGSVELARAMGVQALLLDDQTPYTAARARNAGWRWLDAQGGVDRVQFIDGDCELVPGWLERAQARLGERADLAAVCGRVRERHPERSIYNRLCDIEWDGALGETAACGGNAMMCMSALREVGGFDANLIAGEEPELCLRLRRAGWRIERLAGDMVLHDADLLQFAQWWRRTVRAGHAFAEGAHLHGRAPERHRVRETQRIVLWGAVLPLVALGGALPTLGASTALLWAYPLTAARLYRRLRGQGRPARDAALYAGFTTVGKFAELQGLLRFHVGHWTGARSRIMEHKRPVAR